MSDLFLNCKSNILSGLLTNKETADGEQLCSCDCWCSALCTVASSNNISPSNHVFFFIYPEFNYVTAIRLLCVLWIELLKQFPSTPVFLGFLISLQFCRGAHIDVRNKKGNTPLWLAANGGHFDVVQLLVHASADVDAADNRKITPLMAAYRKVPYCHYLSFHIWPFVIDLWYDLWTLL